MSDPSSDDIDETDEMSVGSCSDPLLDESLCNKELTEVESSGLSASDITAELCA